MEFYVVLLIDNPPDDPLDNLFCGNVGEIDDVLIDEKYKKCFNVLFIDYKKNDIDFSQCMVNNAYLLPLFCFDPMTYNKIIPEPGEEETNLPKENFSINAIREQWEKFNFDAIKNNTLRNHKKMKTQFKVGKLVTIQFDFT